MIINNDKKTENMDNTNVCLTVPEGNCLLIFNLKF
jgi:hypothetical protein